MKNVKKMTKALYALAFSLMLLAGSYGTVLAQQQGGEAAPQAEGMEMMQNCPMMKQMMENCPMMKDGAEMEGGMMGMMEMMENCPMMQEEGMQEMMQNCPMMKGMMQQDGMMQGRDMDGEQSSQTSTRMSAVQEAVPVRLAAATTGQVNDGAQVAKITVGPNGYEPQEITLEAGVPTRLIFTRTTDGTCAKQIQAPAFGIEKTALPLNEPVTFAFTPEEAGTFTFACGMNMMKGTIIVKA